MINPKLRWVLALILWGAACAKAARGLPSSFTLEELSILGGRWADLGLASVEAGLAVWLFSGKYQAWAWRITLGCFLLFAAVSVAKVAEGESSCGCFGDLEVNPWYSFVLDVLAVAALFKWRSRASGQDGNAEPSVGYRQIASGLVIVQMTIFAIALTRSGDDSAVLVADRVGIDRPLSILSNIDIRPQLQRGKWLILFYKNHCSACTEARLKFEGLSAMLARRDDRPRVSFVECPPYAETNDVGAGEHAWSQGRVDTSRRWQLPSPFAVLIEQGVVQTVFRDPRDIGLLESIWVRSAGGSDDAIQPLAIHASHDMSAGR